MGKRVEDLFTKEEMDDMHRREQARKTGFFGGGDWR